jgi:ketosteroid isomerase-like protein
MRMNTLLFVSIVSLGACAPLERSGKTDPVQQVTDAERAFARTMAERDHDAFTSFISEEALFFSGEETLRGRQAVADGWKKYFEGAEAPFSWEPKHVVVLDSGTLAHSSGPVYGPDGRCFATFNSVWRREARGVWRVVFDKGAPHCEPAAR